MSDNEITLFNRRFLILFLVSFTTLLSNFQLFQFSIISNIIKRFYNVSDNDVNWTSTASFVVIVIGMIPSTWILKHIGLRNHIIIASFFNFIATVVKCFCINSERFWLLLISQFMVGVSSLFVQPLSTHVNRVWFGKQETIRASSMVIICSSIGAMCSSIVPTLLVPNSESDIIVANGLSRMFFGQAVISTLLFILILIAFEEKPPKPPSVSEAVAVDLRKDQSYISSVKQLMNRNMFLIIIIYGITIALKNAFLILINQLLITIVHNEIYIGIAATVFGVSRIVSAFVSAYILDMRQCYKSIIYLFTSITAIFLLFFALSIHVRSVVLIFFATAMIGLALGPHATTLLNFASEFNYPVPEGISNGLLIMTSRLLSTVSTLALSAIISNFGSVTTVVVEALFMFIICFLNVFVANDLKRQKVENEYQTVIK